MRIGIPREIKPGETRVAGRPEHVRQLTAAGHEVFVQAGAGAAAGFSDDDYRAAGATLLPDLADIYARAELLWKVKELLPEEFPLVRREHIVFTYLHPAPRPDMTAVLRDTGCLAIAYEEVMDDAGRRPLLVPMSDIAGAGAVLLAGHFAQTRHGGSGKLLFRTQVAEAMTFTIIGGGTAGRAAARAALGAGSAVHLLEAKEAFLPSLRQQFPQAQVHLWSDAAIRRLLPQTDVLVNCTMWMPGDPHLVTRPMLALLPPRSLIMDVSADPNGAIETSQTTSHDDPIRVVDNILHYCVPNIPALFARAASQALGDATWPYLQRLAADPVQALRTDPSLRRAVVAFRGLLFGQDLARAQNLKTLTADDLLAHLPT